MGSSSPPNHQICLSQSQRITNTRKWAQIKTGKVLIGYKNALAQTCKGTKKSCKISEVHRKKINDTLPEWQDIHLSERGGTGAEFKSLQTLWSVAVPRAVFPAWEDVRVTRVSIPEKYNLALEDIVGSCYTLLNTFRVPGSVVSHLQSLEKFLRISNVRLKP